MGLDITGIGSVFDFGSKVLDKIFPDKNEADKAKLAMLQLQQQGELKELENEFALLAKQSEVNLEEAKSSNLFVSGARPAAMWVCVSGLLYTFLLQPIFSWISLVMKYQAPPIIDTGLLIQLLMGMLGLAGLRTFEKKNGVARN